MYIIQVVLNNTRLCQGCIPGKDSHCGHGAQSVHSRGREGARMFCPACKVVSAHGEPVRELEPFWMNVQNGSKTL